MFIELIGMNKTFKFTSVVSQCNKSQGTMYLDLLLLPDLVRKGLYYRNRHTKILQPSPALYTLLTPKAGLLTE